MDLEMLWAIQEGQGTDAKGRDATIVVPAGDPEMGPYTAYSFAPSGASPEPGWRTLTPREALQAQAHPAHDRDA